MDLSVEYPPAERYGNASKWLNFKNILVVSRASTSSPGRIDIKFRCACKAENPKDPALNSENLRFAVALDLSNRLGELSVTLKAKLSDR